MMKKKYKRMYLDWVNNFLTIGTFAKHYGISEKKAVKIILIGRFLFNKKERSLPKKLDYAGIDVEVFGKEMKGEYNREKELYILACKQKEIIKNFNMLIDFIKSKEEK